MPGGRLGLGGHEGGPEMISTWGVPSGQGGQGGKPESATVSARSARECLESPSTNLSEHTESSDIPMNISRAETITDGAVSGANYCRFLNRITSIISSFVRDLMKSPGKVAVALKIRQSSGTPATVNPVLVNLESDSSFDFTRKNMVKNLRAII